MKKKVFTYAIKLRILRWRSYPLADPKCLHKYFYRKEAEVGWIINKRKEAMRQEQREAESDRRCYAAEFEGGEGAMSQEMQLLMLEKAREIFPSSFWREQLILVPQVSFPEFWLPEP